MFPTFQKWLLKTRKRGTKVESDGEKEEAPGRWQHFLPWAYGIGRSSLGGGVSAISQKENAGEQNQEQL